MYGKPPYDDCLLRQHGAYIFACAAAYADVLVHMRNVEAVFRIPERNHFYRLNRAVLGACGAVGPVGFYDAQVFLKNCCPDFLKALLLLGYEFNRARWAGVGAASACVEAKTFEIVHIRAHKSR